ncbi:MAG: antibiotic biosynthesis monooxygenase family protein [Pseudonocardiaceae bacterium]
MEIVLFRIRTREDINQEEYQHVFARMLELVSQVPGFVGIEGFAGEDGSELAVARFESLEAIATWRDQPEHVRTRHRGREEFFASYDVTIATVSRHYDWSASHTDEGAVGQAPPQ